MNPTKLAILVVLIAVLSVSTLPRMVVLTQSPPTWIDQNQATQYVTNLISSYNALVSANDYYSPNFGILKPYLSLYHEVGNSFKVIVVKSVANSTEFTSFLFIPIQSDGPQVVLDPNATLSTLVPFISGGADEMILKDITMEFSDAIVHVGLLWGTLSINVSNDTLVNSKNAAQYLYQSDERDIAGAFQTTTTTTQATTTSGTNQTHPNNNPFGLNWLWSLIENLGIWLITGIVILFGGLFALVEIIVVPKERKRFIHTMSSLWALLRRKNKAKPEDEKSK